MNKEKLFKGIAKGNKDADLKVISLGLGVQSTAVYLMSSMGMLPRADVAIFADPGAEHQDTYKILKWLLSWKEQNNGIDIIVNNKKNLLKEILNGKAQGGKWIKFAAIPAFGESGGMLRRQCTGEYKIHPVKASARKLLGLKKRQRMKPTEMWLGITTDEIQRMKQSQMYNIEYFYPLIYKGMSRNDCINFYKENNFPIPPKSSCVFCPFHSNSFWKKIQKENGNAWKTSVKVDKVIRDSVHRGKGDKVYLHPSCKPLEDIDFDDRQESLFADDLFDCEGHCGI